MGKFCLPETFINPNAGAKYFIMDRNNFLQVFHVGLITYKLCVRCAHPKYKNGLCLFSSMFFLTRSTHMQTSRINAFVKWNSGGLRINIACFM